jgi:hypothetical protein
MEFVPVEGLHHRYSAAAMDPSFDAPSICRTSTPSLDNPIAGPRIQRLRAFFAAGAFTAADHSLMFSFVASVVAAFTCFLTAAMAGPRSEPAMRFAELSHMLMNGFFFSQGLDMSLLELVGVARCRASKGRAAIPAERFDALRVNG